MPLQQWVEHWAEHLRGQETTESAQIDLERRVVDQCHRRKAAQHLWRLTDGKIGDHFFLLCGDVLALAWLELAHLIRLHQVHQA